jgi:hypothetical protein
VGVVLSLLDSGLSYEDLMTQVFQFVRAITYEAVVALLWSRLTGTLPITEESASCNKLIDNARYSFGALRVSAADFEFNTA